MGESTTHAVLALYSRTCALEPISCEVDFVLNLLSVTYAQVPWQGNQLRLPVINPFLAMFIGCACAIQTYKNSLVKR